jgi:AmiR/NasT family two-component response regulator
VEFAVQGRVLIEQAKGMLAVQGACRVDEAAALIVLYSSRKNEFLRSVAQKIVDRKLSFQELSSAAPQ